MCRYAYSGPYKEKWVCFGCRKSFKQTARCELAEPMRVVPDGGLRVVAPLWCEFAIPLRVPPRPERLVLCPQCKNQMHDMGRDFKAPRQSDVKQWQKVERLYNHGIVYESCGCGPGPRPVSLRNVEPFLEKEESRWDEYYSRQWRKRREALTAAKTQRSRERALRRTQRNAAPQQAIQPHHNLSEQ